MQAQPVHFVIDQFEDTVRYATVSAAVALGGIALLFFWPATIPLWIVAVACFLLRWRITFDFEAKTFRDERGFTSPRATEEVSFDEIYAIEVGFSDVSGRYGSYRYYNASLQFTDAARASCVVTVDMDLEKVTTAATELSQRTGIAIRVTPELQKMKTQLDVLVGTGE